MRDSVLAVTLFILTISGLLVTPAILGAHAAPTYTPGVKPGDSALYAHTSAVWNLSIGPPQPPFSQFINLNYTVLHVDQVVGPNVTADQSFFYTNGTQRNDFINGDVAADSGNITFWFIAANLTAGDPISTIPGSPTINQTITMTFAGAPRTVNVYNSTQTPAPGLTAQINVWWDQQTGILLLVNFRIIEPGGFALLNASLVQTNIWSPGPGIGMFANPSSLTIAQGSIGTTTLFLISERGFNGNVSIMHGISCLTSNCPTVTVNPTRITLSAGSTTFANVTITTTNTTIPGSYTIEFDALVGFNTFNSTITTAKVVGPVGTTVLSNDPNSPDWTIDSPQWSLQNGLLDGSGLNFLSPKIISTKAFSSDRTINVDFRTPTPGFQPFYVAWIIGKYLDFNDKATFILGTGGGVELAVSYGGTINYYNVFNTTLDPTQWHHAKIAFAGNTATVYINGTLYLNVTDPIIGALGEGPISLASWGDSESQFNAVTVTASVLPDQPPVANFFYSPQPGIVGQPVFFNASPSFDPDGFITNYSWSFGDGFTGTGAFPTHTYFNPGNYTVSLTVTDNAGLSTTTSQLVFVVQPIIHDVGILSVSAFPAMVISGQSISLSAALVNLGLQSETVDVTFYYGSQVAATVQGVNIPVTQYAYYVSALWDTSGVAPGNYTMSATVFLSTDQNPSNNHLSDGQVTILPPPVLTATPTSGPIGTKVTLQGTGFPSNGPIGYPITVDITFDDQFVGFTTMTNGTFTFSFNVPLSQLGAHQIHAYAQFYPSVAQATASFTVTPTPPSSAALLTITTGSIYFPGDTVTIYLLSTLNGTPTTAQTITLTLLLPNGTARSLSLTSVSPGVYKASFKTSLTAMIGTYALVANAQINGNSGSALANFEIKPTWIQSNSRNIASASIIGAVGTVSVLGLAWKRGYFTKRKDEFPTS